MRIDAYSLPHRPAMRFWAFFGGFCGFCRMGFPIAIAMRIRGISAISERRILTYARSGKDKPCPVNFHDKYVPKKKAALAKERLSVSQI